MCGSHRQRKTWKLKEAFPGYLLIVSGTQIETKNQERGSFQYHEDKKLPECWQIEIEHNILLHLFLRIVVSILLVAAYLSAIVSVTLENTVSGTRALQCEIGDLPPPHPDELIQIGDTAYVTKEEGTLRIFRSYDGCDWYEIESPAPIQYSYSWSVEIFKASDNRLGIVWEACTY